MLSNIAMFYFVAFQLSKVMEMFLFIASVHATAHFNLDRILASMRNMGHVLAVKPIK